MLSSVSGTPRAAPHLSLGASRQPAPPCRRPALAAIAPGNPRLLSGPAGFSGAGPRGLRIEAGWLRVGFLVLLRELWAGPGSSKWKLHCWLAALNELL